MDTDIPKQITPLVRRITAGNPGMFTGPGTNTYLIGDEEVTVIDPGPALHEHIEVIIQASANIKQILLTHTHPDHSPGTRLLQDNIDVPVFSNKSKNVFDAKSESVISIKRTISHALQKNIGPSYLYGIGNTSQKIVRHLEKIKLNCELVEKQLTY